MVFGQDASIPRCATGTNLLIPLPGPIRDEDIAITGAGARLHEKDTSSLSLLYDFEELEGQLDFLTRVVSVTFYPAGSLKIPMTLGQVITNLLLSMLKLMIYVIASSCSELVWDMKKKKTV